MNTYYGCSLVIPNTDKGKGLLEQTEDLVTEAVEIDFAINRNEQLIHPTILREKRQEHLKDYRILSGKEIETFYFINDKKSVLKGRIKRLIPYSLKVLIRQSR